MSLQNAIDTILSVFADGWSMAAGVVKRTLKLSGGDVTIVGNSIQNVTTFPQGNTTLAGTNDLLHFQNYGSPIANPTGSTMNVVGSLGISGSIWELRGQKALTMLAGLAPVPNWPAASTFITGSRLRTDLTGFTYGRLSCAFGPTAPPTTSGTFCYVFDATHGITLAINPTRDGHLVWVANVNFATEWFPIRNSSQIDGIVLELVSTGGNGTHNPDLHGPIVLEIK